MGTIFETNFQHSSLWRGGSMAPAVKSITTEFAALDRLLPGGGWQQGELTELLLENAGIGELRLIIPTLGSITRAGGWIAFIAPPYVPYAPALANLGINLNQLIVLESKALKDQWWAAEQALRTGSCDAVVFWPQTINDQGLRRLQLASQTGGSIGFVFTSITRVAQPSPAPLRIKLSAAGDRMRLDIIKRRGSLVEAPLLLDVGMRDLVHPNRSERSASKPYPDVKISRKVSSSKTYSPPIAMGYANRTESKKLWDQVLAHGDTVKHSGTEDRR